MSASERSVVWAADRPVPIGVTESPVEEWRQVPGFPDYFVSNVGRVRSHRRKKPQFLKAHVNPRGYWVLNLCNAEGRPKTSQVHRLVLLAFVGPCPEGMEACHADGDRLNSVLSNLRWDSRSENTKDQVRLGRHNNARKTHCTNGHAYDDANTSMRHGRRYCRPCSSESSRRSKIRRQMQAAGFGAGAQDVAA